MMPSDFILVGKLISPHGLKGGMKLHSFMERPADIFKSSLFDEMGKSVSFSSVGSPLKKDIFYVSVQGVSTCEGAESLKGLKLFMDKKDVSPKGEDEFLYEDLIGLKVVNLDKKPVGIVVSVQNYGAGDVLEIKDSDDVKRLISFQKEAVNQVDLKKKEIIIDEAHLL